jgi:hypothetical protein
LWWNCWRQSFWWGQADGTPPSPTTRRPGPWALVLVLISTDSVQRCPWLGSLIGGAQPTRVAAPHHAALYKGGGDMRARTTRHDVSHLPHLPYHWSGGAVSGGKHRCLGQHCASPTVATYTALHRRTTSTQMRCHHLLPKPMVSPPPLSHMQTMFILGSMQRIPLIYT